LEPEKALDAANRVLLAPMYLIYDLTTALLPGILFIVLLFLKHVQLPSQAFSSTLFGYKTKVTIALLISYMLGRCFRAPFELLLPWMMLKRIHGLVNHPRRTEKVTSLLMSLVIGALGMPKLFEKIPALDLMVLSGTNTILSGTIATVLITAAAIPGDGLYRWIEVAVGLLMLLSVVLILDTLMDGLMISLGGLIDLPNMFGPIAALQAAFKKLQSPGGESPAGQMPPTEGPK
jgi:hypothetical protein